MTLTQVLSSQNMNELDFKIINFSLYLCTCYGLKTCDNSFLAHDRYIRTFDTISVHYQYIGKARKILVSDAFLSKFIIFSQIKVVVKNCIDQLSDTPWFKQYTTVYVFAMLCIHRTGIFHWLTSEYFPQ